MTLVVKRKKKAPPHLKKRTAEHHRKSQHYSKAYWPYLPMLLIVGAGFVVNNVWASHGTVLGAQSDFSTASLLADTNQQRLQYHENPLTLNPELASAAQSKANDMVARNYWSHDTPDGKTPWSFISAAGYDYEIAGENLAYGFSNAGTTINGWMNSPEHRANILDNGYQNVGFGIASSQDYQGKGPETLIVALYAQPVPVAATITFTVPEQTVTSSFSNVQAAENEPPASLVSRIQILTGGRAAWSLLAVSFLTGGAVALFLIRHGLRLRRVIKHGERYIIRHPLIDTAVVFVATAGFVLTRTVGIIR
jgi:hypothetical protein